MAQKPDKQWVSGQKVNDCENCWKKGKRNTAAVFCKQCGQKQCLKCEKAHEVLDFLSGHDIVDISEAFGAKVKITQPTPQHVQPWLDLEGLDMCDRHKKVLGFFCVDHNALCCSDCAIEIHRQCREVNALSTQVLKTKSDTKGLVDAIGEATSEAMNILQNLESSETNLVNKIDKIPEEIDNIKESVMQMFDALKSKLVTNAMELKEPITQMLQRKQSECNETIKSLEKSVKTLTKVSTDGTPEQVFIAVQVLAHDLEKQLMNITAQQDDKYDVDVTVEYHKTVQELLATPDSLGEVNVTKQQRPASTRQKNPAIPITKIYQIALHPQPYPQDEPNQSPNPTKPAGSSRSTVMAPLTSAGALGSQSKALTAAAGTRQRETKTFQPTMIAQASNIDGQEPIEPLYHGLEFLPDGRLVVTDLMNGKLYLLNEALQKLGGHRFQAGIWDVTVLSQDKLAVSGETGGNPCLYILTVSATNVITLQHTLKLSQRYRSICYMDDQTLIGTTATTRPLRMISLTGRESDFSGLPKKAYKPFLIFCSYIPDKKVLVFTNGKENTVNMYTVSEGQCTERCVVEHESIKRPRGVCVAPQDSVFVCSAATDSIVEISLSGEVLSIFKLNMEFPWFLCVSPEGNTLAVSSGKMGNPVVQLYCLTGLN